MHVASTTNSYEFEWDAAADIHFMVFSYLLNSGNDT